MKHGFLVLLLGFCIMSGIANGKKFVCEKDTIEIESCETHDSSESEVSSLHTLLSVIPGHFSFFGFSTRFFKSLYTVEPFKAIYVEFFSPPPEQ
jgi:hypothetical protein